MTFPEKSARFVSTKMRGYVTQLPSEGGKSRGVDTEMDGKRHRPSPAFSFLSTRVFDSDGRF